jgi:hypothetical protein
LALPEVVQRGRRGPLVIQEQAAQVLSQGAHLRSFSIDAKTEARATFREILIDIGK